MQRCFSNLDLLKILSSQPSKVAFVDYCVIEYNAYLTVIS